MRVLKFHHLTAVLSLSFILAASANAQSPVIVQPGAPGQATRQLPADTRPSLPPTGKKDIEFMQGMIMHHAQAVEMTDMIAERSDNPDLKLIGGRISKSQSDEMEFMTRWLVARGQSTEMKMSGSGNAHSAHSHGGHQPAAAETTHQMPGMLSPEQMKALRAAKGDEFVILFLKGMIQHHEGALTMVKDLHDTAGTAQDAELFNFASDVDSGQRAEIKSMQNLLAKFNVEKETMNRIKNLIFAFSMAALVFSANIFAQGGAMQPGTDKGKEMPAGMKGANSADPRAALKAGLFDAGEAAFGMKHVSLTKKPAAFDVGIDPSAPIVSKALSALGVPDPSMVPVGQRMAFAGLAFANSDLAFQGNHLFMGNFYGINIYDISKPSAPSLVTSMLCPGGQGDVSVYKNLMFMSVEMPNGRLDCGEQGFPATGGQGPAANKDRFRGVRIFDISDIKNPKQVGAVQTCRGSHTHTLVTDPKDKNNVYIYVSGTSFVRSPDELAGCSGGAPDKDPNTALFRIEVIKVPVAAPQEAKVVNMPRIFGDATGKINALDNGGSHDSPRVEQTDQCHDITVYSEIGLAAGACSGNGILLDIKDPANPKRVEAVNDKNYAYWHSAAFSNDGKKVVFTDEWGGGMGPRCRESDPNKWGANAIFSLDGTKLSFKNYYKLPAAQTEQENCVAHNGSLIPVPGRDIKVQAWYQGGISIMDFTDAANPIEIAYFDRGPIDPKTLVMGGSWSAYWYNGSIYSSEIARGLDVFELTPTKHLSQNEINAAKSVKVAELNVQNQEKFVWTNKAAVAKAYVDQLERNNALSAAQIADLRKSIESAESSNMSAESVARLKSLVEGLEKKAADSSRLQQLLAVFE